jgi:pyrimidine-specific ribonucleoside hydrolase
MHPCIKWMSRLLIILLWGGNLAAHDVVLPVIVDTDVAADDVRAIAMLMSSGSADIRLIVTSDGVLSPETGRKVVMNLICCLDASTVPVVAGAHLSAPPPSFRKRNESLAWQACPAPEKDLTAPPSNAAAAIVSAVKRAENQVLYLCLGPMTNLAAAIDQDPSILSNLYRVVYLGASPESETPGWNTRRDLNAAKQVYAAGAPVYGLGLPRAHYPALAGLYEQMRRLDSPAAKLIVKTHDVPQIQEVIANGHMRVWDELTIIYVNLISGFDFMPDPVFPTAKQLTRFDEKAVGNAYIRLLGNPSDFHLDARKSVVLTAFPTDPQMMRDDIAPFVLEIIDRHGTEEWKACLLTNELHRHLGIYSLVGAKMGIRAREILEAPFDTLSVVSHAGLKPPLSCMNDGLQVSTGASLGRGTIAVITEDTKPSARFATQKMALELTLKPAYVARIKQDIKAAINRFGGLGPDYFAHIRTLSIKYWKEFDRNALFEERFVRP